MTSQLPHTHQGLVGMTTRRRPGEADRDQRRGRDPVLGRACYGGPDGG
jgi:hypothetical protein